MVAQRWLVTGGAGFIGSNAARTLSRRGAQVIILDNLSRETGRLNLSWLQDELGKDGFVFVEADVRDEASVTSVFREHGAFDVVLHLAGQVAVTTSVAEPRADLETNALGSFNVLEATRQFAPDAAFLNASTNKVYGQLAHHRTEARPTRYVDLDAPGGISEREPLDPHSPYGCSKGAADVYTLDYARIYGLNSVSLRQSCIYGPRQYGVEDQGWVAWFALAAQLGRPLTIFGDGKQVRDLLHVDDLVDLYLRVAECAAECRGRAYNVGGGPENSLSLLELLDRLEAHRGQPLRPAFAPARAGDQLVFVADTGRAADELGWRPHIGVDAGLEALFGWIDSHAAQADAILRNA